MALQSKCLSNQIQNKYIVGGWFNNAAIPINKCTSTHLAPLRDLASEYAPTYIKTKIIPNMKK